MKNKIFFINILLLIIVIYLGLLIFQIDVKSLFIKSICKHCNVVLISLDTLGAEHLPCYGYERNTSPNLCNFAKNNVFFTNMFSNAGWTLPSHFSIFTSLYPNHHQMIFDDESKLAPNINMMAEFFKKADYKTIYVAPLSSSSLPLERGLRRGFDTTLNSPSPQSLESWDKGISQLIKNNKDKQNTFLFLHTYWVHSPYVVGDVSNNNKRIYTDKFYEDIPLNRADYTKFSKYFLNFILEQKIINESNPSNDNRYRNIYKSLKNAKNLIEAEKIYNNSVTDIPARRGDLSDFYFSKIGQSDERVLYSKALYDEMIFYLDKKLTTIFDLVKNKDLANNTIIIITSDHGEEFMEHESLGHPADHLYNTTTTVPFIMYIPGVKQKKIDNLVQSIDILPTILNLTGLSNSKYNFDGIDLTDLILGRSNAKKNKYLISEGPNTDSIREDRWKLYVNGNALGYFEKLFDTKNDPLETNSLVKKQFNIVKILYDELNKIIYKK